MNRIYLFLIVTLMLSAGTAVNAVDTSLRDKLPKVKTEKRMPEASRLVKPPRGLKYIVIQPADFQEASSVPNVPSKFRIVQTDRGTALQLRQPSYCRGGGVAAAYAPVKLPDGAKIEWLECFVIDVNGMGTTEIGLSLYEVWLDNPSRGTIIARVQLNVPGRENYRVYRAFTRPNTGLHRINNEKAYYLLKLHLCSSRTKVGPGLRGCRVGYRIKP